MRKEDAREIAKVGGKFLLIGPPIGVLLMLLFMISTGRFLSAEVAWHYILFGIPFSYLLGGLPALAAGLTYGLAALHLGRLPAAITCSLIGALASGLFGSLVATELKLTLSMLGALSSLLVAALCRPPKRPQADSISPTGGAP